MENNIGYVIEFKCSKCGACCRRAGQLGLMPQRKDGACIHLDDDNTCKIYDTRPDLCRANVMAEVNRKKFNLSLLEYYKMSNTLCNEWIKEDGLDDSFLINIGDYERTDGA